MFKRIFDFLFMQVRGESDIYGWHAKYIWDKNWVFSGANKETAMLGARQRREEKF